MKAGADYKYHWLLQQAEMELGSLFQSVTNPKARSLLIVLLQNIWVSGFSEDKVFKAAEKGICCSVLSPDVGYQTRNPTKELRQLYDRTVRLQSADLALRRTGVENFQNSHKVANEHKLTWKKLPKVQDQ